MEMGSCSSIRRRRIGVLLFGFLLVLIMFLTFSEPNANGRSSFNGGEEKSVAAEEEECDIYKGKWVLNEDDEDHHHLIYSSSSCPFIRKEFDCQKYGRPDSLYLNFIWKPSSSKCNLPRFDGGDFLKRFKGKKIMFIGDSLSLNFWQSLICLLHAALPSHSNITRQTTTSFSAVTFQDYGVSVILFHSFYLVDTQKSEKLGRVLNLNSIKNGDTWKKMDVLIFNTWLWWSVRGIKQPWDYIQLDGKVYKDMNRTIAFQHGLTTWAKWVAAEIDPVKTKVFFQGISPFHYKGKSWNEPGIISCSNETRPLMGETYPSGLPEVTRIIDKVLSNISSTTSVSLLNITTLSQLRKDSHPSTYNGFKGMDCAHWCIPGLPDTWSQLLYAQLIS